MFVGIGGSSYTQRCVDRQTEFPLCRARDRLFLLLTTLPCRHFLEAQFPGSSYPPNSKSPAYDDGCEKGGQKHLSCRIRNR